MDEMIANAEQFYQTLGIPYRIVNIVSGREQYTDLWSPIVTTVEPLLKDTPEISTLL